MNLGLVLGAVAAVTLAEMGDKTQLLAMAFATKYKSWQVLIGVFVATIFNHGLAVALGSFIARYQALDAWIQGIAAVSFIFFGLWTIKGDTLEEDEVKGFRKFGPIMTVTIAFFIAELGDKTQLATISLAAQFPNNPFSILTGTTIGMMIADAFGILVGVVMGKAIPERTVKWISAVAFMIFGFIMSYEVSMDKLGFSATMASGVVLILVAISTFFAVRLAKEELAKDDEEEVVVQ